jgi:hypothetical protein
MTIKPLKNIVFLKIDRPQAGDLDISSRDTAIEFATVLAIGSEVTGVRTGDTVFVKAWAVDIVTHGNQTFHFCNLDTGGLLAVVKGF